MSLVLEIGKTEVYIIELWLLYIIDCYIVLFMSTVWKTVDGSINTTSG